jgi:hypothetical protein
MASFSARGHFLVSRQLFGDMGGSRQLVGDIRIPFLSLELASTELNILCSASGIPFYSRFFTGEGVKILTKI